MQALDDVLREGERCSHDFFWAVDVLSIVVMRTGCDDEAVAGTAHEGGQRVSVDSARKVYEMQVGIAERTAAAALEESGV